jgi:hypothetical protein
MKEHSENHKFKFYNNVGTPVKQWLEERDIRFLSTGVRKN